jgi:hypothetical protein
MSRIALLACLSIAAAVSGCREQWYGAGTVYVYNGTDAPVRVEMEGAKSLDLPLAAQTGQLLRDVVAGPYDVRFVREGAQANTIPTEIHKDELTILNVDGAGCFARADVAGLYSQSRNVVVHARFKGEQVFRVDTPIDVLPSEPLPRSRPKSAFGFQRVVVAPCSIIEDDRELIEHVQQHK